MLAHKANYGYSYLLWTICNIWKKNDDFWEFRKMQNVEKIYNLW